MTLSFGQYSLYINGQYMGKIRDYTTYQLVDGGTILSVTLVNERGDLVYPATVNSNEVSQVVAVLKQQVYDEFIDAVKEIELKFRARQYEMEKYCEQLMMSKGVVVQPVPEQESEPTTMIKRKFRLEE